MDWNEKGKLLNDKLKKQKSKLKVERNPDRHFWLK